MKMGGRVPEVGARRGALYFVMKSHFPRLIAATGIRGRVAIANLCLCQTLLEAAARSRAALVLCEFYWEFVEQDLTAWHARRRQLTELDEIGKVPGRTGRMLELVDLAATEYVFSVVRSGPDRLCVDLADAFAEVFGDDENLLVHLCAISPIMDEQPKSRWDYLTAWSRKK
jgi:hypothetical protein